VPFIFGRQLDNYKLIISMSSIGCQRPVSPDLGWLVCQCQLEASTLFGPVLESSRLPLFIPLALSGSEVNGAQVGSFRGCLARSLLDDDVFPCGGVRWTG
jgi:hypothetical protein